MLSFAPGIVGSATDPDATSGGVVLAERVHHDDHLLLWCLEGRAEVVIDGDAVPLGAAQLVVVPVGARHALRASAEAVVYPVFIDAARVRAVGDARPAALPVGAALADALLLLRIAEVTELMPAAAALARLHEVVAAVTGLALHGPAVLAELPGAFIPPLVNEHDDVVLWCVSGRAEVALLGGGARTGNSNGSSDADARAGARGGAAAAPRTVPLAAEQALLVPAGLAHRVHGAAGGVVLPVFLPAGEGVRALRGAEVLTGAGCQGSRGGRDVAASVAAPGQSSIATTASAQLLRVHGRLATALHVEHLASTSLLARPGWSVDGLVAALAEAVAVPVPTGAAARRADAVRERLLRHPGDTRPIAALAAELGVTGRQLERDVLAATGGTLRDWRHALRMRIAADRLRAGRPAAQVAAELGFAHASGFSRAFRRHHGASPTAFAAGR